MWLLSRKNQICLEPTQLHASTVRQESPWHDRSHQNYPKSRADPEQCVRLLRRDPVLLFLEPTHHQSCSCEVTHACRHAQWLLLCPLPH